MSLTKHILKEYVSDAKENILHKKMFFQTFGIYDINNPIVTRVYDFIKNIKERSTPQAVEMAKNRTWTFILFHMYGMIIKHIDNTPNKKYIGWFLTNPKIINPSYTKTMRKDTDEYSLSKTLTYLREDLNSEQFSSITDELDYLIKHLKTVKIKESFIVSYNMVLQDVPAINELFDLHFKLKQRADFPQELKDINNFKSYYDFQSTMEPYLIQDNSPFEDVITKINKGSDYEVIYKDGDVQIFKPLTEEGACVLGYRTNWCTTWGQKSYNDRFKSRTNNFKTYSDSNNFNTPPLYIFRWLELQESDSNKYIQIYIGTDQPEQVKNKSDIDIAKSVSEYLGTVPKNISVVIIMDYFRSLVTGLEKRGQTPRTIAITTIAKYKKHFDLIITFEEYKEIMKHVSQS